MQRDPSHIVINTAEAANEREHERDRRKEQIVAILVERMNDGDIRLCSDAIADNVVEVTEEILANKAQPELFYRNLRMIWQDHAEQIADYYLDMAERLDDVGLRLDDALKAWQSHRY